VAEELMFLPFHYFKYFTRRKVFHIIVSTIHGSVKYPVQLGYVLYVAWLRIKYRAVKYQIRLTSVSDTALLSIRMLPCVGWSVVTGSPSTAVPALHQHPLIYSLIL